jgi:hypothetical protein
MSLRVGRGLFRLWLVLSLFWVFSIVWLTWQTFVQPPYPPRENIELMRIVKVCSKLKSDQDCSRSLEAAGGNPFEVYVHTLKWEEGRLAYIDGYRVLDSFSIQWAQVPMLYLFLPPIAFLLVGSMLYWAFRGFSPD